MLLESRFEPAPYGELSGECFTVIRGPFFEGPAVAMW